MLTLRQLLNSIELLEDAQVVAGAGGLDHIVQWPQIADIPGMTDWLQSDELLLTTAFALQEPAPQQQALVGTLAEKGLAGMIVAVGRFFDHVPQSTRATANTLDFPIIEIPWQIPLLEVGKQISRQIIAQQRELLAKSLTIHQTLTQLVVEGSGLEAVARALARLLDQSVTIEDPDLTLLAYARRGTEDEARRLSIHQLRTPQHLVNRLEETGLLSDLQRSPRPMRVGSLPAQGIAMERIIAPIVAGEVVQGYVWVIAGNRPLNQLDFAAIEHAATVAALIMTKERAIRRATERRYGDLLNYLLSEDAELTSTIVTEARELGLVPGRSYGVLLIRCQDMPPDRRDRVEKGLRRSLEGSGQRALMTRKREDLVAVLTESGATKVKETLAELQQEGVPTVAGFGGTYAGLSGLYRSYREAREAGDIHAALASDVPFIAFRDLGILHWLYHLPEDQQAENIYVDKVRTLAEHDAAHDSDLLSTLEVYLDHGANASAAAKSLYVHRSTLLYRLEKCETLCDVDLSSPFHRLNFQVALKAWRIKSAK